ncbi:MAG TPA: hypothetical protein VFG93_02905 [Gaiellaceae bacterium]|nr:hypothetical protein [Gaiellaceae bacterium]
MRLRSVVLLWVAVAAAIVLILRRPSERVDVQFDDGSTIRFTRGPEARDLLDAAYAILEAVE